MKSTIREHAGAGVVALATVIAAVFDGAFSPSAFAILSVLVWGALVAGLLGRALPSAPVGLPAVLGGALFAAVAVLAAASISWASDQGRAFEEAVRVSAYLGMFVLAACSASEGGRRQWLGGLTLGLGVVAVLAVFSYLEPRVLEPEDIGEIVPNAAGRLSYPVGYWNALAGLVACATVLLADSAARSLTRPARVGALAVLPVAALALWLTDSRGGVAAAIVGLLIVLAASRHRSRLAPALLLALAASAVLVVVAEVLCDDLLAGTGDGDARSQGHLLAAVTGGVMLVCAALAWWLDDRELRVSRPSRRMKLALVAVAVLAVAGAVVAADPAERFEEFKETPPALVSGAGVAREANSSGRWQFWSVALDAFDKEPVRGIGAGSYESWWGAHASIPLYVRNPHSLPMQQLAELGLAGALLLAGFLVVLGYAAVRRLRAGPQPDTGVLIGVAVAGGLAATVDWTWQFPACFAPVVVAAALLMAAAPGRALARRAPAAVLTAALAVVSIAAAGALAVGELRLEQSRSAAAEGRIDTSFERARQAKQVLPFASKPYLQLALLEELEEDYGQALVYLEEARERDQGDWRLALLESRIRLLSGDDPGSQAAYERAGRFSPLAARLRDEEDD